MGYHVSSYVAYGWEVDASNIEDDLWEKLSSTDEVRLFTFGEGMPNSDFQIIAWEQSILNLSFANASCVDMIGLNTHAANAFNLKDKEDIDMALSNYAVKHGLRFHGTPLPQWFVGTVGN